MTSPCRMAALNKGSSGRILKLSNISFLNNTWQWERRMGKRDGKKNSAIEEPVDEGNADNSSLTQAQDGEEGRSRRENLRIYNVPEGAEGSSMVVFVEKLLRDMLDIPSTTELYIERAHQEVAPRPPENWVNKP